MNIKKILVSQPKPSSEKSPYYDIASRYGVEIVFRPFIKVEGLSSKEFRQQKVSIADFTAIIFTARTAIDHFFRLCEETRVSIPDTMKYFCTTEAIALYLQRYIIYRKRKIFFGKSGKLDDLIPSLTKHIKEKFLLPVADVHKDTLSVLNDNNIPYTTAVMYRTVSNDFAEDEAFDYDMLMFFSPSGIDSLKKNFPNFEQGDIRITAFGPATAKAVRDGGLRLDIEAPTAQYPSMTGALDAYLKEEEKKYIEEQKALEKELKEKERLQKLKEAEEAKKKAAKKPAAKKTASKATATKKETTTKSTTKSAAKTTATKTATATTKKATVAKATTATKKTTAKAVATKAVKEAEPKKVAAKKTTTKAKAVVEEPVKKTATKKTATKKAETPKVETPAEKKTAKKPATAKKTVKKETEDKPKKVATKKATKKAEKEG